MTTTKEKVKVMLAQDDGEDTQFRRLLWKLGKYEYSEWFDCVDTPLWNWSSYDYRTKPKEEESKPVPFYIENIIKTINNCETITICYSDFNDIIAPNIPILINHIKKSCPNHKCNYVASSSTWLFTKQEMEEDIDE